MAWVSKFWKAADNSITSIGKLMMISQARRRNAWGVQAVKKYNGERETVEGAQRTLTRPYFSEFDVAAQSKLGFFAPHPCRLREREGESINFHQQFFSSSTEHHQHDEFPFINLEDLVLTVDWRSILTEVREQGNSPTCLPLSLADLVGAAYAIDTGKVLRPSPQFIIDTLKKNQYMTLSETIEYVYQHGLPLEIDYPSRKKYRKHKPRVLRPDSHRIFIKDYEILMDYNDPFEMSTALQEGPLLVNLRTSDAYDNYDGNKVLYGEDENKRRKIVHSQLIIGEGFYRGIPIWLVRGTYSSRWGLKGLALVYREMKCGRGAYGINTSVLRLSCVRSFMDQSGY